MKFLVDAQLPRRMAAWLREHGHDALHTLDLPEGNRTTDAEIVVLAGQDDAVVVTREAASSTRSSFIISRKAAGDRHPETSPSPNCNGCSFRTFR